MKYLTGKNVLKGFYAVAVLVMISLTAWIGCETTNAASDPRELVCPAPEYGVSDELREVCTEGLNPLAKCPLTEEWLSRLVSYCESMR